MKQLIDSNGEVDKVGRTAIILSGLIHRSLRHAVESLREKVVAPLAKLGEVDIFYHSWDVAEITNPRTGESGLPLDRAEVVRWLPEATGIFESQKEFDGTVQWEPMLEKNLMRHCTDSEEAARTTLMNFRRALESQERAWQFFERTKMRSYARVVVTRGDLRFLEELNVASLCERRMADEEECDTRRVTLPNDLRLLIPRFHAWGGVNDRFAMGGEKEMEIYCCRTAFSDGWLLSGGQGNSEQILMKWLERNRIRVELLDFTFQRVRANGEVAEMDRNLKGLAEFSSMEKCRELPEEASAMGERFLILARETSPASQRLLEILSPLGLAEVIVDTPGEDGIWYPNEELGGYEGLMGFSSDFPALTAWSRAMYHLALTLQPGEAVWFVEDDVAGNAAFFKALVSQTAASGVDLAAIDIHSRTDDPEWHCWTLAEPWFDQPTRAFEPLCRVSADLIIAALEFRREHGRFTFHEVLFSSLAALHGMQCLDWNAEARFRNLLGAFQFRPAVELVSPGISHPVKDPEVHDAICTLETTPEMVFASGKLGAPDRDIDGHSWFEDDDDSWRQGFVTEHPVRALEIGSRDGLSANFMLETLFSHRESQVHCIENFDSLSEQGANLRAEFMENVGRSGHESQTELYEGASTEILAWMIAEEGYWEGFDFIHHAGGAGAAALLADACLSWNLLKPGGVMVFSGVTDDADFQVRAALDGFLGAYAGQLRRVPDGKKVAVSKLPS